jgi:hypothetical protein
MGKTFSRFGKFSVIILLNILCIPWLAPVLLQCRNSQVWSFNGVIKFLHIPFIALELFE